MLFLLYNCLTMVFTMPTKPTYKVPVDAKAIGKRLRDIRLSRGLDPGRARRKASMTHSHISDYERGNPRMNISVSLPSPKR